MATIYEIGAYFMTDTRKINKTLFFLALELISINIKTMRIKKGAQLLSGRVLDLRSSGRRFEPHLRHCVFNLSKTRIICLDPSQHD